VKDKIDAQPKNETLFDRILFACGYVLICLILTGVFGFVVLLGALAALAIFLAVLFGMALFLGGLVLTGVGLVHFISMPRGSFINLGSGMILAVTGVLTELFLFWAALDVVPWIIGKIRKMKPHVMAKDIRRYCGKVLRTGIILGVIGMIFIIVGLLLGGAKDIRKRTVLAYRETMDAIEDAVRVMPFSRSFQNMNLLSFDYRDKMLQVSLNDYYDLYQGDKEYTVVAKPDEVKSVKVSTLSGVFSILPNEADEYAVQSFESGDYQVFVEDETLIVDIYPYLHSAKEEDLPQVMLFVPKDVYLESFEVYCSGRAMVSTADLRGEEAFVYFPMGEALFIDRLDFNEVHVQSGLGDLTVEHLNADTVHADGGSGEMSLKNLSAKDLYATESSGRLSIRGEIAGNIDIRCGMGEVEIDLNDLADGQSPGDGSDLQDRHFSLKGTPRELTIGDRTYKGSPLFYSKEGRISKTISIDTRLGRIRIR
jgi:hypothetical protein